MLKMPVSPHVTLFDCCPPVFCVRIYGHNIGIPALGRPEVVVCAARRLSNCHLAWFTQLRTPHAVHLFICNNPSEALPPSASDYPRALIIYDNGYKAHDWSQSRDFTGPSFIGAIGAVVGHALGTTPSMTSKFLVELQQAIDGVRARCTFVALGMVFHSHEALPVSFNPQQRPLASKKTSDLSRDEFWSELEACDQQED